MKFYRALEDTINRLTVREIPDYRQEVIQPLIDYLTQEFLASQRPRLNFICTHNSRRSQMAQVWAHAASQWYGLEIEVFSGGVEVTAFNSNAIDAIGAAGFHLQINNDKEPNPTCFVKLNEAMTPLKTFSKLFDHEINPRENFAAVMTCSDADENCPFIPGTEQRIPLLYDDPKLYDKTEEKKSKYLERSEQIGSELLFAFKNVKAKLN